MAQRDKLLTLFKEGKITEDKFLLESYRAGLSIEEILEEGIISSLAKRVSISSIIKRKVKELNSLFEKSVNSPEYNYRLNSTVATKFRQEYIRIMTEMQDEILAQLEAVA